MRFCLSLSSAWRTHVCQLPRVDLGHLQNDDSGANDCEGEDDGDDLRSTSLQTLVQDNRSDQGAEGDCMHTHEINQGAADERYLQVT